MKFAVADICSAFEDQAIGTRVLCNPEGFLAILEAALATYDTSGDRVPGQHFVRLPCIPSQLSAGVGKRTDNPDDYVLRAYRGQVHAFLKRDHAAPVTGCNVVLYTLEAYKVDPDVTPKEYARVASNNPTHVIVAILAHAGPPSKMSAHRFVANLAGGNNEALTYTADDIRAMAKDIVAYHDEWTTVAD